MAKNDNWNGVGVVDQSDTTAYGYGTLHANQFFDLTGSIFKIVILLILSIALYRVLLGRETVSATMTFETFLQTIHNAPVIDIRGISTLFNVPNVADIPIIGGLLNFFVQAFAFISYLAASVMNVIVYVTYCIGVLLM